MAMTNMAGRFWRADETDLAPSTHQEEPILVLKADDLFAVFDDDGGIRSGATRFDPVRDAEGLYFCDTRILSRLCIRIGELTPEIISATTDHDNVVFTAYLKAPAFDDRDGKAVPAGVLRIKRRRFLWQKKLFESLTLHNGDDSPINFDLISEFEADFRDIFEIRGNERPRRGNLEAPTHDGRQASFSYVGLDNVRRVTKAAFSTEARWTEGTASIGIALDAGEQRTIILSVAGTDAEPDASTHAFFAAMHCAKREHRVQARALMRMTSDDARFNAWMRRSASDLSLLVSERDTGPYPYAGIPWFSTAFGRDALITALQTLWLDPGLTRGVLGFLAERQADRQSDFQDSEPGKILHETRGGEMAALNEVPFGLYYGGVDSTPLFVVLAGAYFRRTADTALMAELWPNIERALAWIETYGDRDGDGLLEYQRGAETGLANQGWKDSHDSVFHRDGTMADGPIALVEVQGYAYEARRAAALIARALNKDDAAEKLEAEAAVLAERIESLFWSDEIDSYALALDGKERPCQIRASNMGHLLYTGCVARDRARRMARTMTGDAFYSGWGIRTVAEGEARYDPVSYHNGSVWPHDTSIAAAGFARYGDTSAAAMVLDGLFAAACGYGDYRLPELFSGQRRNGASRPEEYPGACAPQAWAAGSGFLALQSALGLTISASPNSVVLRQPRLPAGVNRLRLEDLPIGKDKASFTLTRDGERIRLCDVDAPGISVHLID